MYEPGEGLAEIESSLDLTQLVIRKVTVDGVVLSSIYRNGSYG